MNDELQALLNELIDQQRGRLLELGRKTIPNLTTEDILQPNDYPDLEYNPLFRYEEGVLEGMQTVDAALRAALGPKLAANPGNEVVDGMGDGEGATQVPGE